MSSTSYKDRGGNTQYNGTFHAITKSAREAINQASIAPYNFSFWQLYGVSDKPKQIARKIIIYIENYMDIAESMEIALT